MCRSSSTNFEKLPPPTQPDMHHQVFAIQQFSYKNSFPLLRHHNSAPKIVWMGKVEKFTTNNGRFKVSTFSFAFVSPPCDSPRRLVEWERGRTPAYLRPRTNFRTPTLGSIPWNLGEKTQDRYGEYSKYYPHFWYYISHNFSVRRIECKSLQ